MSNKNFKARIGIEAPLIAADDGTTAITLSGDDVTVVGDLTVTSNVIKSSTATTFTLSGADAILSGDLQVNGNNIASSTATAFTLSGANVTVAGDLTVTGNDIKASGGTTALTLSGANVTVAGDLTVNDAVIFDGSTSGTVTIAAPAVAGTQSYTLPTAVPAVTGYVLSGTTGGALSWVANPDTNTTYDFNATSTSGGANLNLVGSDSTTDTVKLTDGGHITATYTSGTAVTLGSDATNANTASTIVARDASGNFTAGTITAALTGNASTATQVSNSLTAGTHLSGGPFNGSSAVTLSTDATNANTASTIVARDASGDFSAGTVTANLANNSYVLGALQATTNTAYAFVAGNLNTTSANNGVDVASSMPAGTNGNTAQQQLAHYFGDTGAGNNTSASLSLKTANGNSVTGGSVPYTGVAQVAASGVTLNNTLGTTNYNGFATTNFSDYVASQGQGGGFNAVSALQIQGVAAEAFVDGTLTITPTAVTRTAPANLSSVAVSGTRGQITFTSQATPSIGQAMVVTGTNTGTSTGIVAGTYYLIAATGTTGCTLSATPGGDPLTTTAGTTTGLTFARRFITVTWTALGYIPFGANAKITIANITGVTDGTYMAVGTSTTTSVSIGVVTTSVALGVGPALTCPTVTAMGGGLRIRAIPLATPGNSGNRVELVNHNATTAKYRSDTFVVASAAYGTTGVDRLTVDSTSVRATVPFGFPNYTVATAGALAGALGQQIAISNSSTSPSQTDDGMMAYWATNGTPQWRYIHNNGAL
jgi:hypothetical protein